MTKKIIQTGILILTIFTAFPSLSHKKHQQETGRQRQVARAIYERGAALHPELIFYPFRSLVFPHSFYGKQRIDWDSVSGEIAINMMRLYRDELQTSCPFAINENAPVRDYIAKGFIASNVLPPFKQGILNVTEIGSKYGETAATAKGVAEGAETAVSVSIPWLNGIHLACHGIDVLIAFFTRKIQIYTRGFINSRLLNQNRLAMMARLTWVRRKMKKVEREVLFQLDLDRIDIDPEGLQSVNEKGRKNNRKRYIETLSLKINPLLSQIKEINEWMKTHDISPEQEKRMEAKKEKLYRQIAKLAAVSRKDFFGSRYGLSIGLFSRKGKRTHLKGQALPDRFTSHPWLWPEQIRDILEESLLQQAAEEIKNIHLVPEEDEIRRGLAEEFYENLPEHLRFSNKEEHLRSVEYAMNDIGRIFDSATSVEKKHFLTVHVGEKLIGTFNFYLQIIFDEITQDIKFWSRIKLKYKIHQFEKYSYLFQDFLLTASLTEDPAALISYKYEAMENFLVLHEYLTELSAIAHSAKTVPELFAALDENLHPIQVLQVHRKKRTTFSLIPFKKPTPPLCRDLVRKMR